MGICGRKIEELLLQLPLCLHSIIIGRESV